MLVLLLGLHHHGLPWFYFEVKLEEELLCVHIPFRPKFALSLLHFSAWNLGRKRNRVFSDIILRHLDLATVARAPCWWATNSSMMHIRTGSRTLKLTERVSSKQLLILRSLYNVLF